MNRRDLFAAVGAMVAAPFVKKEKYYVFDYGMPNITVVGFEEAHWVYDMDYPKRKVVFKNLTVA